MTTVGSGSGLRADNTTQRTKVEPDETRVRVVSPCAVIPSQTMWRHSLRRVGVTLSAFVALTIFHPTNATAQQRESTDSTTTTTVGFELSDDFLVLYPEYDDDQYQYLLPNESLLPQTGPAMRVGIGALTLLVFGAAVFALGRGPRRRRRAHTETKTTP